MEVHDCKKEKNNSSKDIAIIGMACRFPGADNYDEFWEILKEGKSGISEVPKNRWDWEEYWGNPLTERNKTNSKWGGFINNVAVFDNEFFGLSAREIEATDPQQRIMLELSWACFEDAGICPSMASGKNIGVFMGAFNYDYKELQEKEERTIETYHSIGTANAVIANRLSYYFNLKGPSLPVDTACSSSLSAIHLAANSLIEGESELALAGGINLLLTPTRHISFSKTGMLSPTGSCKTFDEQADGYVRGEGAGVILMKPLQKAIEDGNSIYAVLKGSAINHNGKTYTLTYPNDDAQAKVISDALRKAEITPESIGYIEAHGTGTPKGDPIEFQGLVKGFQAFHLPGINRYKNNFCGIGSLKTNVGHLEAAAGIAGVIKVILAMKYSQIPGLQNFQQLNHRIKLEGTPFYIVEKLRKWQNTRNENGVELPKRAGVSSFGFGGTNAHVILEEAPLHINHKEKWRPCYLIVLSAKTKKDLRKKQDDLLLWLEKEGSSHDLTDLCSTLFYGRETFEHRVAFVINDYKELISNIRKDLDGENSNSFHATQDKDAINGLKNIFKQYGETLIKEINYIEDIDVYSEKLKALAELYVNGCEIKWEMVFPTKGYESLRLPTYPFNKENQFWINANSVKKSDKIPYNCDIHPLIQQNCSSFYVTKFESTFNGDEFFLRDHIINNEKTLPGVAYLEMVWNALKIATEMPEDSMELVLENVVWNKAISIREKPCNITISLEPDDNKIYFTVGSAHDVAKESIQVYCQGIALEIKEKQMEKVNISILINDFKKHELPVDTLYEIFKENGFKYGPAQKGLEEVYVGKNQILAHISLPECISDTFDNFILHPSIMDSALQAGLINILNIKAANSDTENQYLPYSLKKMIVLKKCTETMWALISPSEEDIGNEFGIKKINITLMNQEGVVCVFLEGLGWKETQASLKKYDLASLSWKELPILAEENKENYDINMVINCGTKELLENLEIDEQKRGMVHNFDITDIQNHMANTFEKIALELLNNIKEIIKDDTIKKALIQVVLFGSNKSEVLAGLWGILKTARIENPKFFIQMVQIEDNEKAADFNNTLLVSSQYSSEYWLKFSQGRVLSPLWQIMKSPLQKEIPWKDEGVYLIIGGMGKIGYEFAKEIIKHTKNTKIILVGRSERELNCNEIVEVEENNITLVYKKANIEIAKEVNNLIENIENEYGALNGIIHSAGILQDEFIIKKTEAQVKRVFCSKVYGVTNLDNATKNTNLDFFVMFSSVIGILGNLGQADYAAANAYLDAYARYRNQLMREGKRFGKTISICWPLWQEGGMKVPQEIEQMFQRDIGMLPMQTHLGIDLFYNALSLDNENILVLVGNTFKFLNKVNEKQQINSSSVIELRDNETRIDKSEKAETLLEKCIFFIKDIFSSVLKLPTKKIDESASMDQYGIDSIMIMQLTAELEKYFGVLSKTLFFEYHNIYELSQFLLKEHYDKVAELIGEKKFLHENDIPDPIQKNYLSKIYPPRKQITNVEKSNIQDIAIIGVAGRYPGADNMRQFWENLSEGKDCVTEIPKERWNYELYYNEDKNTPGKSYCKWGGFINDIESFDPLFFNISPKEAELMDPQERLFLECVYEAIEDAGYTRNTLISGDEYEDNHNVGVYVGVMYDEYQLYGAEEQIKENPIALNGIQASIANRISYYFDFHGPCMTVNTMCSSSLTAIHLACQSIISGESEISVAGGVNLSIHPNKYLFLSQGKFVSSQGKCSSFGVGGDGYVPGEGVGAFILKPIDKAIEDHDQIYGVIKSTVVNHGGKTNGFTVPNPNAQANAISRALKIADIDARTISYVEAHGTGTVLGDPIEIVGLSKAFGEYSKDNQFCAIGSAKANIGHCESAAGIAGVTKVLLQFKKKLLVPSLHSSILNPNIDFSKSPFKVQHTLEDWKLPIVVKNGNRIEYPRRAGISSFGAGGSNAHLIIEEFNRSNNENRFYLDNTSNKPAIIILSAKTEEQLQIEAFQLLSYIEEEYMNTVSVYDIAYTLQVGRESMEERLAIVAIDVEDLISKLNIFINGSNDSLDIYIGSVKQDKDILSAFGSDSELLIAIEKWFEKGKYTKLLQFWVRGMDVDWNKIYGDNKPYRISLPTYPFKKEKYWIPNAENLMERTIATKRTTHMLEKAWTEDSLTSFRKITGKVAIIVCEETLSLGNEISKKFEESEIINIKVWNPDSEKKSWEDYDGLIDITGCSVDISSHFNTILLLQQAIEGRKRAGMRLLYVTAGTERYNNIEGKATGAVYIGLYRMLQSEYNQVYSCHLDLEVNQSQEESIKNIIEEYMAETMCTEIHYHTGIRYKTILSEFPQNTCKVPLEIKEDAVLWITGGTRGLGYICAKHAVEKWKVKKLVLLGKEELPPRKNWSRYLDDNSNIAKKIRGIIYLEEQGAQVKILSGGLEDETTLRNHLHNIEKEMGSVIGVIHCAGKIDMENPAFIRKPLDNIKEIFSPKIIGLNVLYNVFSNKQLRFFINFSSVSAIIPALATGQSDYCTANSYMDYFAQEKEGKIPICSVQWPSWKETGMGEIKNNIYKDFGLLSITNNEAMNILDNIISYNMGPVIMPIVVNEDTWETNKSSILQAKAHYRNENKDYLYKNANCMVDDNKDGFEKAQEWIRELLAEEIKIDSVRLDYDINLRDYGVDSVMLVQLQRRISQNLNVELDPSIFLEYPNIKLLAQELITSYKKEIEDVLNNEKKCFETNVSSLKPVDNAKQTVNTICTISSDVAIVGMSCNFPGASSIEEFWNLIKTGTSAINVVANSRWENPEHFYAGMLDDIHAFDEKSFHIPKEDAAAMDPQALLLLQESVKLLSHSGYMFEKIKGTNTGVYIGGRTQHIPSEEELSKSRNPIVVFGQNYLAANISQYLDLHGPSVVVDSACSSALVCMNMAISDLQKGTIDMAIVGGVGVLESDRIHRLFRQRGILSPNKEFYIFDGREKGIVLGEGVGMVLLKSFNNTKVDEDTVYARIKGVEINNDGRTAGPATPNIEMQKQVMENALLKSGVTASDVSYIETNGSGTEVTDILELKAIESVYGCSNRSSLEIGSVKPNIGHTLCAEGIAAFIKVALMLYHQSYVPFISGDIPMKHFNFDDSSMHMCREIKRWDSERRIAAINSFADGGTNAHVILEEWKEDSNILIESFSNDNNLNSENSEDLFWMNCR